MKDAEAFDTTPPNLESVAYGFAQPPDYVVDSREFYLSTLVLTGVGPIDDFNMRMGERLTVVAGDNAMGKSFIMDINWWAMTGHWPGHPILPIKDYRNQNETKSPTIKYTLKRNGGGRKIDSLQQIRVDYPFVGCREGTPLRIGIVHFCESRRIVRRM